MAVVTKIATGLPDRTAAKPGRADVRRAHGRLRISSFVAEITNGDSAGSTFEVARLPSHARIAKSSAIRCTALTGVTDVDLGPVEDPDCIVDGLSLASAGTKDGAGAITVANSGKALWELAGLASDPKKEMPIFLTLNTAATAGGVAEVDLHYVVD